MRGAPLDARGKGAASVAGKTIGFEVFKRASLLFAQADGFAKPGFFQRGGLGHARFQYCSICPEHTPARLLQRRGSAMLAAMKTSLPLSLIAALARNRVIGIDNRMPWHLPEDFKYFKATTLGKPIIMGRKTWDSLGRPLPGRLNLVVSRQTDLQLEGAEVYPTLDAAIVRAEAWAHEQGAREVMLIGGAQLYELGLARADRLYLTRVALTPEGDAWFPAFDEAQWQRVSNTENPPVDDKPGYDFEVWERVQG
jgi:dihydrofolate reductase